MMPRKSFTSSISAVAAIVFISCSDPGAPVTVIPEEASIAHGQTEAIIQTILAGLSREERQAGGLIGVLDSGRTADAAVVVVASRLQRRFHRVARTGRGWQSLEQQPGLTRPREPLGAAYRYPGIMGYTDGPSGRVDFYHWNVEFKPGIWYNWPGGWRFPGWYFGYWLGIPGGYAVAGDTAWAVAFTEWKYFYEQAACPYTGAYLSNYSPDADLRRFVNGVVCGAQAVGLHYSVSVLQTAAPVSVSLSGPQSIILPGTVTWTASASGGTGEYSYQWTKLPSGESLACGSSCAISVGYGHPSFTLQVTATSTYSYLGARSATTSMYVAVDVYPLTVRISGPEYVQPYYECSWHASVVNGSWPYSYSWSGRLTGSTQTIWGGISRSGNLFVTVTDAAGRVGKAQYPVEALWSYPAGCGGKPVF